MSSASSSSFASNVVLARSLAHRASLQLLAHPPSHELAFPLFLQAAQTFALLVRQATGPDKDALRKEFKSALERAERCKSVLKGKQSDGGVRRTTSRGRCDPLSQDTTLAESSTVDVSWGKISLPQASPFLPLGPTLPNPPLPAWSDGSYVPPPEDEDLWIDRITPEMLQQDRIGNCSLVTGLQVLVAWDAQHGQSRGRNLLKGLLEPSTSDPTKYRLNLHLNGSLRTIHVDNLLPLTAASAPVGISLEDDDGLPLEGGLGVQVVEKGWMCLQGGWEVGGSNSSVDLYALTGWVPEIVSLRESTFKREQTWTRLHASHRAGSCLMTLGTGYLSSGKRRDTGLISRHDYSVLELVEEADGKRLVKVLNPWKRKARLRKAQPSRSTYPINRPLDAIDEDGGGWASDLRSALEVVGDERVFSMPWEVVVQVFDSIYLNWDPTMFGSKAAVHSSWSAQTASSSTDGLSSHPRFQLHANTTRPIWLHLNRHLSRIGPTSKDDPGRQFIGIRAFDSGGGMESEETETTMFTNSAHQLVKIVPTSPSSVYTVIVPTEGEVDQPTRFTLTALAIDRNSVRFEDPPPDLPYASRIEGSWVGRTAGGSPSFPSFMNNPMYQLVLRPPPGGKLTTVDLRVTVNVKKASGVLDGGASTIGVNVKLVWGKGERITNLVRSDIVLDSGSYRRDLTLCSRSNLQTGKYTLVVSTFEPDQEGDFELDVQSTTPLHLTPIPQEGNGLRSRTCIGSWNSTTSFGSPTFGHYWRNPTYTLHLPKDSRVLLRVSSTPKTSSNDAPPIALNITLFRPTPSGGPPTEVLSSGPYSDALSGAVIPLQPLARGTYKVVWSTFSPAVEGQYAVRVFCDGAFEWDKENSV